MNLLLTGFKIRWTATQRIECIASYLADITTAKPYAPGKFEKKTTSEALKDVLSDTGWEVSEQTEYDGLRTTSCTLSN